MSLPLPQRDGEEVELVRTEPGSDKRLPARTRARIRAMDVLFEADMRGGLDELELLAERKICSAAQSDFPAFAAELVHLHAAHSEEIDDLIATHAVGWTLERMPAVDRAILRLGTAELVFSQEEQPVGAVLGQYVDIATSLSTGDSPRFVNALLQRIVDMQSLLQE